MGEDWIAPCFSVWSNSFWQVKTTRETQCVQIWITWHLLAQKNNFKRPAHKIKDSKSCIKWSNLSLSLAKTNLNNLVFTKRDLEGGLGILRASLADGINLTQSSMNLQIFISFYSLGETRFFWVIKMVFVGLYGWRIIYLCLLLSHGGLIRLKEKYVRYLIFYLCQAIALEVYFVNSTVDYWEYCFPIINLACVEISFLLVTFKLSQGTKGYVGRNLEKNNILFFHVIAFLDLLVGKKVENQVELALGQ